jgi:hypothetical protein
MFKLPFGEVLTLQHLIPLESTAQALTAGRVVVDAREAGGRIRKQVDSKHTVIENIAGWRIHEVRQNQNSTQYVVTQYYIDDCKREVGFQAALPLHKYPGYRDLIEELIERIDINPIGPA